jgi:hypothetical protein
MDCGARRDGLMGMKSWDHPGQRDLKVEQPKSSALKSEEVKAIRLYSGSES